MVVGITLSLSSPGHLESVGGNGGVMIKAAAEARETGCQVAK